MLPTNKVRIDSINFTATANSVSNGSADCLIWGGASGGRATAYICPFDMFVEGMVLNLDNEAVSGFIGSGGTCTLSLQTADPSNYATTILTSFTFSDTDAAVSSTTAEFLSAGTDIGEIRPCFVNNTTFPNSGLPVRLAANTLMSVLIEFANTTVSGAEVTVVVWVSQADNFGGSFAAPR